MFCETENVSEIEPLTSCVSCVITIAERGNKGKASTTHITPTTTATPTSTTAPCRTCLRVDKCTMYLILHFSWPADVLKIGMTCRWCHALSLRPEIWSKVFLQNDILCAQFCLQDIPCEAHTKRTEKLLTPLLNTLKDKKNEQHTNNDTTVTATAATSTPSTTCFLQHDDQQEEEEDDDEDKTSQKKQQQIQHYYTKNDYLHIVRLVSFYSKHTAHQRILLRLWEEQILVLLWRSYLFAVCAITAGSFISVDFEQPPSDLFYVFGVAFSLPFLHACCRIFLGFRYFYLPSSPSPSISSSTQTTTTTTTTSFSSSFALLTWRTYEIFSITFLLFLWALASFLCYRCTNAFSWVCPVFVQLAIFCSGIHIIFRLNASTRVCSRNIKGGCILAGVQCILAILQVLLVALKLEEHTNADWVVLWAPTWAALIIGFFALTLFSFFVLTKTSQKLRVWCVFYSLAVYLSLLVLKLDHEPGLEWVHVWIPLLFAECIELVMLLGMCRKQHNRHAEIEVMMSEVRKIMWSQEILISDISVLETLSDYFYATC